MENCEIRPFHLAIPVDNLPKAEWFYGEVLGCSKGRQSEQWIDWNFYGHQLVTHLVDKMPLTPTPNQVDAKYVPVPHFGVVLSMPDWRILAERMQQHNTEFVIEPYVRFAGQAGEQATMFFLDPSGNALEFKAFNDLQQLFAV
ncbi:VOC family protein [Aliiglaciecola sp. 3_MG-2023]|uniref:VOC family protein n=1 Tax=Aliiglaciecola sp. 3_MG-2023 TaxID=3062644 RepID=UPI0026E1A0F2|nr:VOC family protein [Aliiglaciecola sp. 3_MG-2023]MDO6692290.1 VOC family protein [Aliiglaciecola sp. 3_MG-2023]